MGWAALQPERWCSADRKTARSAFTVRDLPPIISNRSPTFGFPRVRPSCVCLCRVFPPFPLIRPHLNSEDPPPPQRRGRWVGKYGGRAPAVQGPWRGVRGWVPARNAGVFLLKFHTAQFSVLPPPGSEVRGSHPTGLGGGLQNKPLSLWLMFGGPIQSKLWILSGIILFHFMFVSCLFSKKSSCLLLFDNNYHNWRFQ